MEKHKVVIIGSGPAGYTAAIYAARANMKPVMIMGMEPGGQLMQTNDVENFPGYPEGIMGPEMMEDIKKQAERFGTDIRLGLVTKVDFSKRPFLITIDDDKEMLAESVILSTGATAKYLGLESEQRLMGMGVSACATCDGFFYRDREVALVGAGDSACEEALYLANLCTTVHMIVRRDEMRASKIMQERVFKAKNIKIYWNSNTDEVLGEKEVEGVRIVNNKTGEKTEIPIYGFFVAIGHKPNSDVFKDFIKIDDSGYVLTEGKSTKTNIEGVFACGDLQDSTYRQAITAAGTGCMAALDAERFIGEQE